MATNKLSRKGFVAWLQAKHPRTLVGRRATLKDKALCPIDLFTGGMTSSQGCSYPNGQYISLPVWARAFIRNVDSLPGSWGNITAGKALKLLGGK